MSEQINNGGSAFPVQDAASWQAHGMTLRDYFAAHEVVTGDDLTAKLAEALMGSKMPAHSNEPASTLTFFRWWAEAESRYKFMLADAMLAARGDA